ncbi:hypothetical protein BC830DRAFT_1175395 [Chytriomyces sp. MP71]|nr:hypothetical protein BC830DRAFT_1175395 [Chytriomyces sp. MP71]
MSLQLATILSQECEPSVTSRLSQMARTYITPLESEKDDSQPSGTKSPSYVALSNQVAASKHGKFSSKKSLRSLFTSETQGPSTPPPLPSKMRRSAVSVVNVSSDAPATQTMNLSPAERLSEMQNACTTRPHTFEDVQARLFTTADVLSSSAANLLRKSQTDSSPKTVNEAFTSYRFYELAERLSCGLEIDAAFDFETIATVLRMLAASLTVTEAARRESAVSALAGCRGVARPRKMEAVAADDAIGAMTAKSEADVAPRRASFAVRATHREAVSAAPKGPKEGWLSVRDECGEWVDAFVIVTESDVKILLSSLDATTYLIPVDQCSVCIRRAVSTKLVPHCFVINENGSTQEYVLGSKDLKDVEDWVGRITNFGKKPTPMDSVKGS